MFSGKKGFCLVEVVPTHPMFHLAGLYTEQVELSSQLETRAVTAEAELKSKVATFDLLQEAGTSFLPALI